MTDKLLLRRVANVGMGLVGAAVALGGVIMPLLSHEDVSIAVHHLQHAGMAAGAGLLALALAAKLPPHNRERGGWVLPAVLAPVVGLVLMWPSEYAWMEHSHLGHFLEHLGIALCSFLAVFAAQAYVRGLGWPMLVLLVGMDAAAAGGFGVSPGPSSLLSEPTPVAIVENPNPESPATLPGQPVPLHVVGRQLSQTLGCITCHHVDGTKGLGPTWKNLAGYPQKLANGMTVIADYQFLTNAILYPRRQHLEGFRPNVMPNLYRGLLSGPQHPNARQLNALIWYINSLSDRSSPATRPPVPDAPGK